MEQPIPYCYTPESLSSYCLDLHLTGAWTEQCSSSGVVQVWRGVVESTIPIHPDYTLILHDHSGSQDRAIPVRLLGNPSRIRYANGIYYTDAAFARLFPKETQD